MRIGSVTAASPKSRKGFTNVRFMTSTYRPLNFCLQLRYLANVRSRPTEVSNSA
jgi:hypothetical protein